MSTIYKACRLSTNTLANKWKNETTDGTTKYYKLLSADNFSGLATTLPGLLEDQWRDIPRLCGAWHRPHHLDPGRVPYRGQHHIMIKSSSSSHHLDPGRVPHRGLQAISIARICTAYQVFSAANSVIPEIGAINDWDNVAIVMKFSSGTLAQVK